MSSSSLALSEYPDMMGNYSKILTKFRNGKPVWKKTSSSFTMTIAFGVLETTIQTTDGTFQVTGTS